MSLINSVNLIISIEIRYRQQIKHKKKQRFNTNDKRLPII